MWNVAGGRGKYASDGRAARRFVTMAPLSMTDISILDIVTTLPGEAGPGSLRSGRKLERRAVRRVTGQQSVEGVALRAAFGDHGLRVEDIGGPPAVKEASATSQTADCVCLKRPPPARVLRPRATPGLQLATLQASGRVARVPRRCAVTHASVVQESISPPIVGTAQ